MARKRCPSCGGSGVLGYDIERNQTCTACSGRGFYTVPDPAPAPTKRRQPPKDKRGGKPNAPTTKQKGLFETLFGNNPPAKKPANKTSKPKKAAPKEPPVKRDFWEGLDEKPPKAVVEGIIFLSVIVAVVAAIVAEDQTGSNGQALVAGMAGLAGSALVLYLGYYALKIALVAFKIAAVLAFVFGMLYLFSEIQ